MDAEGPSDAVRAFREMFLRDLRADGPRPLGEYAELFPEDREAVAAAYRALEESIGSEAGTTDGPSGPPPEVEPADDAPVTRIGPFRIGRQLGTGGMGAVYLAEPDDPIAGLEAGTSVALKVVHAHLVENKRFLERFRREAELGRRVMHENVARTYDVGRDDRGDKTHHYIAMEFVEGRTLREVKDDRGRLPEELCRRIARDLCRGLAAIHAEGVVHRDVKPENVLLTPGETVKLMDLGVAKAADATTLTEAGQFVGSVQYAAPEQFKGQGKDIDGRADLHALGLVLYELASGEHPFGHDDFRKVFAGLLRETPRPVSELNPAVSPFFEQILQTLLEKDRNDRFASADEALGVLESGEDSAWWRERSRAIVQERVEPLRQLRVSRDTDVLGRDAELAALHEAFEAASTGRGRVVLLEGEAGIGKTRLVDEAVSRLEADGTSVAFLFGSYPPIAASPSRGAFASALLEHFGRERLEELLARYLSRAPPLVPAFAAFLRDEAAPEGAQPLDAQALQAAFVHVVQALAAERPLVLLIDDLHFAPKEGRDLFAALVPAVAQHRVLLLGATRPAVHEEWAERTISPEHAARITVERLDPSGVTALLTEALHSESLAQELADQVVDRASGNPFFVLEILRGLEEGRFLTRTSAGTWEQTGEIGRIRLPDSLAQVIGDRVRDLDEEDREVLEVAACCGFDFDPLLVGSVLGMKEIPLLRRLGRLERSRRLVHAQDRRFVFDHHQIQETLYGGLSELLRERYHAAIAETLEEAHGASPSGVRAVEICEHALAGGSAESARRHLGGALDHLGTVFARERMIALAERGLATAGLIEGEERVATLLRRGHELGLLGRVPEQRRDLREAVDIADAAGEASLRARTRFHLGQQSLVNGSYEEGLTLLEEALELTRACGDQVLESNALRALANLYHRLGRHTEAVTALHDALVVCGRHGSAPEEISVRTDLASLHCAYGSYDDAVEQSRKALEMATRHGLRREQALTYGAMGIALRELGRYDDALANAERHLTISKEVGSRRGQIFSTLNFGVALRDLGRLRQARRAFEQGRRLARECGTRDAEAGCLVNVGQVYATLGDLSAARVNLETCEQLATEIGYSVLATYANKALGDLARQQGDADGAERLYLDALQRLRDAGSHPHVVETLVALGALEIEAERGEDARGHLEEARAIAAQLGSPNEAVLSATLLALLPDSSAEQAEHALATFEEHATRLRFLETMEARFLLWKATGRDEHAAAAGKLLDRLVENAPDDAREAIIANVPLHRAIRDAS